MLASNGFGHVQIVAPDGGWGIFNDVISNQSLNAAVYAYGLHYPGTVAQKGAVKTGKRLWSSEDYSTFNDNVGAGCWARVNIVGSFPVVRTVGAQRTLQAFTLRF